MSNQNLVTRPEIRAVKGLRYAIIPPPVEASPTRDTSIIPPDDRSLNEWVCEWQEQARALRRRLVEKVQGIVENGRQGNLGLTSEANERTPAQAVALITRSLIEEKRMMDALGPQLAKHIHNLQECELDHD